MLLKILIVYQKYQLLKKINQYTGDLDLPEYW